MTKFQCRDCRTNFESKAIYMSPCLCESCSEKSKREFMTKRIDDVEALSGATELLKEMV